MFLTVSYNGNGQLKSAVTNAMITVKTLTILPPIQQRSW